jgi:hypothetical protein
MSEGVSVELRMSNSALPAEAPRESRNAELVTDKGNAAQTIIHPL